MIQEENDSIIQEVLDQIIPIANPETVILYNCKYHPAGDLYSFKLCIVCEIVNKRRLLSDIFEIDCDVPFDVLLYTPAQFQQLRDDTAAFANRVSQKGKILYGK